MSLVKMVAEYERKTALQSPMVSEDEFYDALEATEEPIRLLYELYRCQHSINVLSDHIVALEARLDDMCEEC